VLPPHEQTNAFCQQATKDEMQIEEARMRLTKVGKTLRLYVVLSLLSAATWLGAQNTTSCALSGTVTDTTGAVVTGVAVTVTNQATGIAVKAATNNTGYFTAESLAPGDYTINIKKSGFRSQMVKDVHLDPGQRRGADLKLDVGDTTVTVTVEADAVVVQTESADLSGTVSEKEVANLMLNGRNFQSLAMIVPGVSSANGANQLANYGGGGYLGQTAIIVGGTSVEKTTYTIDGLYDMDPNAMINVNVLPTIDSISEFKILKDNYSAKYGLAGSGQILVETKSGGSKYHGDAYEYVRNNFIGTAAPYLTAPGTGVSALHYNIFGYTLGGPVTIPHLYDGAAKKTFFFAGGEWRINHYPAALRTRNMLPQTMRNGDFSASPSLTNTAGCPAGQPAGTPCLVLTAGSANLLRTYRGIDPTTCIKPDPLGRYNQLNTACMDPTSVALMNAYWPLPTPSLTTGINYINNGTEKDVQADYNYRIDHSFSDKNQITARWTNEEVNDLRPSRNYNDPAPNPGSTVYSRGLNSAIRWTTTITPNLINTVEGGETYNKWLLGVSNFTMPAGATIAQEYPGVDPFNRIPDISIGGGGTWAWLGVGAQPNFIHDGVTVASDDVSWLKGNHLLQTGIVGLLTVRHVNANSFPMGNFSFSGTNTQDSAADYLLGLDATYSQSNEQPAGRFHNTWLEAYVQDDWKVNPRLAINLGVRWSYYRPTYMEGDQVTNFNASTWVAANAPVISLTGKETLNSSLQPLTSAGSVANLTNGLVYAGVGISRGFINARKDNIGPRVGFAYRLTNDGKTSLHGGLGFGFTQVGMLETSSLMLNPPFVQSTSISNSLLSQPTAGGAAGAPGIPGLTVIGPDYQPTVTKTFSLGIERQVLPNAVAQVAYAGSLSQHVMAEGYNYNFSVNGTSPTTVSCAASGSNPLNSTSYPYAGPTVSAYAYDPCLNSGAVSTLYYAPYPGYGTISGTNNGGIANYNGLQTGFAWKARDLTLNGAYTWSKALEDVQPSNPGANGAGVGYDQSASFQNPRNKKGDYGIPDYDRKHVFTSAWVYRTPFFAHSSSFVMREFLSGWGSSGLAVVESGLAVTPSLSVGSQGLAARPNLIAPVTHPGDGKTNISSSRSPYFSPASFQAPAWGEFGNAKPGMLRGPKEVSFSTAVDKTFPIREGLGFKLRVEAFNIFNHPNTMMNGTWSGPTSTFGTVVGAGDARQMEFSGRLTF
jgi:hypothetical protein